jgi:hypothetical protein
MVCAALRSGWNGHIFLVWSNNMKAPSLKELQAFHHPPLPLHSTLVYSILTTK